MLDSGTVHGSEWTIYFSTTLLLIRFALLMDNVVVATLRVTYSNVIFLLEDWVPCDCLQKFRGFVKPGLSQRC